MAEISLSSLIRHGGPHVPLEIQARFVERPWDGGGTARVLRLVVGDDKLEIWPAEDWQLADLAARLTAMIDGKVQCVACKGSGVAHYCHGIPPGECPRCDGKGLTSATLEPSEGEG